MTMKKTFLLALPLLVLPVLLDAQGQGIAPDQLTRPLGDSWPTYSGDYTGKRFSSLKQINTTTVKQLSLAWVG